LAENKTEERDTKKKPISIPPMAIVIFSSVLIAAAGFWYLNRPVVPKAPPPLSGDARAYVRNLALSGVNMEANETYLSQQLVEITGNLGNKGNRVLRTVEINCVFYDPYGQVVLRERVPIVTKKMGGLAPGETKPFRLAFDDVPDSWNQALPQLVIAGIDFS
jgi:hypothetical protein